MTAEQLDRLQAACGGSIPLDRLMAAALYDPESGYYTKNIRSVGTRGDFSTWPGLDASLSQAVADWLGERRCRHVIEAGAGTGAFAAQVLRGIGWLRRMRTTYHIVEISPVLRGLQQKSLRGRRVRWHASMAEALAAAGGDADIFSNELPDAFPCRVFVRSGGDWREVALRVDGAQASEVLLPAATLPDSSAFRPDAPQGSRIEVLDSYRGWLREWAPKWRAGRMLTVDYGDVMPSLYRRRPEGTLRAYAHHQRFTGSDIWAALGKQDITSDVNFTDLADWGRALGWRTRFSGTLSEFLTARGVACPARMQDAGDAFRTLWQDAPDSGLHQAVDR